MRGCVFSQMQWKNTNGDIVGILSILKMSFVEDIKNNEYPPMVRTIFHFFFLFAGKEN